jgi:hypothetical protein
VAGFSEYGSTFGFHKKAGYFLTRFVTNIFSKKFTYHRETKSLLQHTLLCNYLRNEGDRRPLQL